MSVPVLRLERRDDLEIIPAATTRSPDSPEFGLTLLHQYLILNYQPPTQGMRARSGWQTVLPSSTGKYTFHPPDGQMELCVRSVYSEYAEIEELASDPSTSRTVIVAGTFDCFQVDTLLLKLESDVFRHKFGPCAVYHGDVP